MLCFDLDSKDDGVFIIPYSGMSGEEAILRSKSFMDIARIIRATIESD
jgi:hypothetical protein